MKNLELISNFSQNLAQARKSLHLNQAQLALKVGVSRDMIVRMERGDNVGIHHILAVLNALGRKLNIIEQGEIISGSFDEFYQKKFGESLKSDLNVSREDVQKAGIFNHSDKPKMKVKNWKQAAHL